MENVKNQIDEVVLQLEAGRITEEEAHLKIAEITTSIPEEEHISEEVKAFMQEEINKMELSEEEKLQLKSALDKED